MADRVRFHLVRLGRDIDEIAVVYNLDLSAIYSALAYYYDHRDEIDGRIEKDDSFVEAFRRNNPSLLREKLEVLKRAWPHSLSSRQARGPEVAAGLRRRGIEVTTTVEARLRTQPDERQFTFSNASAVGRNPGAASTSSIGLLR